MVFQVSKIEKNLADVRFSNQNKLSFINYKNFLLVQDFFIKLMYYLTCNLTCKRDISTPVGVWDP